VKGAPVYKERECWRCDRGRVYQPDSARGGLPSSGWVPCTSCGGTGKVIAFV